MIQTSSKLQKKISCSCCKWINIWADHVVAHLQAKYGNMQISYIIRLNIKRQKCSSQAFITVKKKKKRKKVQGTIKVNKQTDQQAYMFHSCVRFERSFFPEL